MNNAILSLFEEVTLATTEGSEVEVSKYVVTFSTTISVLTSKDGDFSSVFDEINEGKVNNPSFKEILTDNHTSQANKGKLIVQIALKLTFEV